MRVAIASFAGMPPEFPDDERLLLLLRDRGVLARRRPWNERGHDWGGYDLVVARSVWDYTLHHSEFCEWVRSVRAPVENDPELIVWNSDKRYLGDLAAAGLPVVETTYVSAGDPIPPIESEVVIKPTISAGGRDTGRFGPSSAERGQALIERIVADGRTAMVQPFLASVDEAGETAIVVIAGKISHALHKRAVLRPDEVAPVREDELGAAEAMYDPGLVTAGAVSTDEIRLAHAVLGAIADRFGIVPLYARVDMLRDPGGQPVLLELEAIEPNLYFDQAPGAAELLADEIVARAAQRSG